MLLYQVNLPKQIFWYSKCTKGHIYIVVFDKIVAKAYVVTQYFCYSVLYSVIMLITIPRNQGLNCFFHILLFLLLSVWLYI